MVRRRPGHDGQTDLFDGKPVAPAPPAPAPGPVLPDQEARDAIARELHTNLLVEAGAGAGKTTEMVHRMLAHVRDGVPVERIAAVTFTRKAAAELRERFQNRLEAALREPIEDAVVRARVDTALRHIDRAFLGTIHAFCARLLRERPLEAGIDPGFREVFGAEQVRLSRRFWATHVERAAAAGDERLARVREAALSPAQVYPLFERLVENPDVDYPTESVPRPDAAAARAALESILDRAHEIVPRHEPEKGWDRLQSMIRQLRFLRRMGWSEDVVFLDALAQTFTRTVKIDVKYKYDGVPGGRAAAAKIEAELRAFADEDTGPGGRALAAWRAHRYPLAMEFARAGAEAFAAERRRNGTLFFTDLLVLAARLLRASATARAELGERYRHLLVDEFQDTDPLQAEVLLLLASEPTGAGAGANDWRTVVPRAGALFVVGDPKQSIYRFRRADIALYGHVRARFASFGRVLELVSNFRSRPPIERFVNAVFEERLPATATPAQAAFAPLRARRPDAEPQGVSWYRLGAAHRAGDDAAADDADRLASWVASRIASGERAPGDFLVLTRTKKFLPAYARAFEARNVPVQVTGAGLGIEAELSELRLLLEALADPADATLTLAALVGLFFGLDYEALAEHVLDRDGRISFTYVSEQPQTEVERALARLNAWWRAARHEPADVLVARIVEEQGLLPYAAGGPLGESRAGALRYVLDAVREAALDGDATLSGALGAIDAALEAEEAEAPLEPGRDDVVRLMNLHQAKGLEAPVIVLAAPVSAWTPPIDHAIERAPDGTARGWTLIAEKKEGFGRGNRIHAAPLDWDRHEAAESVFDRAEEDRLLYVACTRAGEELVVARPHVDGRDSDSPWAPLYPILERDWPELELPSVAPPPRARLELTPAEIERRVRDVDARRQAAARATYHAEPVTARVKGDEPPAVAAPDAIVARPRGRGTGWGTAVHGALEAAARGATGDRLRSIARGLLIAAERPQDADGTPRELDELVELVRAVATSDLWRRASRAARHGHLLVEAPFALSLARDDFTELMARAGAPPEATASPAPVEIVEGVVDLAFHEGAGWTLVDYKSDAAGTGIEVWRRTRYRAQLGLYAAAWARVTGQEVVERVLLYTATGETESW